VSFDKKCGDCSACCVLPEVPELKKPCNVSCSYLLGVSGGGCSIYESRPTSCREFRCQWLVNESAQDDMRPDRCGVMFEKLKGEQVVLALFLPESRCDKDLPKIREVINAILRNNFAVVSSGGVSNAPLIYLPSGVTKEMVRKSMWRFWHRFVETHDGCSVIHN